MVDTSNDTEDCYNRPRQTHHIDPTLATNECTNNFDKKKQSIQKALENSNCNWRSIYDNLLNLLKDEICFKLGKGK